jgi:hypothetical protein
MKPQPAPIFLRAHTRADFGKRRLSKYDNSGKEPDKWAKFALVFDCETTIDIRQDLNFLWWRFCELKNNIYVTQLEGLAYDDGLTRSVVNLIRDFAKRRRADVEKGCPEEIRVQSRSEFVNGEFWDAASAGATIVCFNSPFDLSRLALEYEPAQKKNSGWSTVLWKYGRKPDKFKPRLQIKPKDSRSAFISFAGGNLKKRVIYRGRFLDLSVLVWALRNKHLTLDGALRSFRLKGKMKHEPTGCITKQELIYGRKDVERTLALLNATKREYERFPLTLPPERAMSAASIAKAFLAGMAIERPREKFKLPDDILGKCMQTYYGGRSEIRIRHTEMPVVVCDATSEYPSVAVLLSLWPLLTAAELRVVDCTREARKVLKRTNLNRLLSPEEWKPLNFFALVKPARDVLPIRSLYSNSAATNIGVNPLTSKEPIWYAGPDLAGAKLLGTKSPRVIRAFRLVPRGMQAGMESTNIGLRNFNPESDDFFRTIIEERQKLSKKHPHNLLLKIIANSLYGIFAELNKDEFGRNAAKRLHVFSGEHAFSQQACSIEVPGRWQFPPAAALITAAGRLMLAILERMVADAGGTYLLTDTDSMLIVASKEGGPIPCRTRDGGMTVNALTWNKVKDICTKLNKLNPYDRSAVKHLLKIEPCNYDRDGIQQQLFGLAVSAKRYVVYRRTAHTLEIIKPSEHGLGLAYVPDKRKRYKPNHCKDRETDYPRWIVEAWERLLELHFRGINNSDDAILLNRLWFANFPAMMRVRVTTPNVLAALRKINRSAAKPYNFAQSPILLDPPPNCTLVAPSSKRPEDWLTRNYTDTRTGRAVKLNSTFRGKKVQPQTLSNLLWRHFLHPEAKSLGPDGNPCEFHTTGLLQRRPISAMTPFQFIGKEIERKAQEGEDISALDSSGPVQYCRNRTSKTYAADPSQILRAKKFGLRQLVRESGVQQHAVERFRNGERVHPSTRVRLLKAMEKLEKSSCVESRCGAVV